MWVREPDTDQAVKVLLYEVHMHEIERRMAMLRLMLADITARQEQSQASESAARARSEQQADRQQPSS